MRYNRIGLILSLLIMFLLTACASLDAAVQVADAIPPEAMFTATPVPTATPSPIEEAVSQVAETTGIDQVYFLGLTGEDWVNLVISVLFVILIYVLSRLLVRYGMRLVARRIDVAFENEFLAAVAPPLSLLPVIFSIQYATTRLTFILPRAKTLLSNLYFGLGVLVVAYFFWQLTDFTERWYREKLVEANGRAELDPVLIMLRRVVLIFIVVIAFSILLSRFGLNTNALTITLGIVGVALTLAAQDTISDTVSGFLILADQPFRVGDVVEVKEIDDWGIVNQIGLRTTRLLTYDNRMVIVPNSIIGKNPVINYSYPDPRYRVETRVWVPHGTEIKTARKIIAEAIRQVEGVLDDETDDKTVEVLCHAISESAMVLRVWWWIGNYDDVAFIRDRVIETIQDALLENGLSIAHPVSDINLEVTSETMTQLSRAFGKGAE